MQYATTFHNVSNEIPLAPFHPHVKNPESSLQDAKGTFNILANRFEPFREVNMIVFTPICEWTNEGKRLQESIVCKKVGAFKNTKLSH